MAMPVLRFLAAVALLGPVYSQSYSVANDYESPAVPNLTPLSNLGEIVDEKISSVINSKTIQFVTPFPDSGRKSARLESAAKESIPIQHDIKYAKLQQFVANLLHPKPIVDTIQEHEKYGNDGGKGRAAGTALVAAVEGISNALNAAVDAPFKAAKTAGKKITNSLNQIGGKLVGLA
ncbi:uncharacterized protein LOC125502660 [Dendroctonus ponderosae]|uniref:uncharacterized protein LOC125502660 n=1 Tax=Dendroctonus ponderosae TaxID=77166 RepID=UPI002035C869|nr:uncharacterized protein LOC125502660 [Dendroctonus ponderosae]KAH1026965.1 hypothetical protein HUJ05_000552 [Dendroctonus ponderosae]